MVIKGAGHIDLIDSDSPGWAQVTLDLGDGPRRYRRELNVMPQWAGSCWYYLRYLDPGSETALAVLPSGTVNVWAREVGIPLDAQGARQVLVNGQTRHVDVGRINGRYFLLMVDCFRASGVSAGSELLGAF